MLLVPPTPEPPSVWGSGYALDHYLELCRVESSCLFAYLARAGLGFRMPNLVIFTSRVPVLNQGPLDNVWRHACHTQGILLTHKAPACLIPVQNYLDQNVYSASVEDRSRVVFSSEGEVYTASLKTSSSETKVLKYR